MFSNAKVPELTISSPTSNTTHADNGDGNGDELGVGDDEAREYRDFLEKARREAEKKEKEMLRSITKARETNMSPWAGRM